MYCHVEGTWKSPVLMSGSVMLPQGHLPSSWGWDDRGITTEGLYFQRNSLASSTTKLLCSLSYTLWQMRGVQRNTIEAAAQGIHVQKSLTTQGLSADSTWVCKGGFPAGCHASNAGWVLMWADKVVNSPSLSLFHSLFLLFFTSKAPEQLDASQHKAKSDCILLMDNSVYAYNGNYRPHL